MERERRGSERGKSVKKDSRQHSAMLYFDPELQNLHTFTSKLSHRRRMRAYSVCAHVILKKENHPVLNKKYLFSKYNFIFIKYKWMKYFSVLKISLNLKFQSLKKD